MIPYGSECIKIIFKKYLPSIVDYSFVKCSEHILFNFAIQISTTVQYSYDR